MVCYSEIFEPSQLSSALENENCVSYERVIDRDETEIVMQVGALTCFFFNYRTKKGVFTAVCNRKIVVQNMKPFNCARAALVGSICLFMQKIVEIRYVSMSLYGIVHRVVEILGHNQKG